MATPPTDPASFDAILKSLNSNLEAAVRCAAHLAEAHHGNNVKVASQLVDALPRDLCAVEDSPASAGPPVASHHPPANTENRVFELRHAWQNVSPEMILLGKKLHPYRQDAHCDLSGALNNGAVSSMSPCMLDPHSSVRLAWDLLSVVFITFDIVTLPLVVLDIGVVESIEWLITLFWTMDVAMSCRTGFHRGPLIIMDQKEVFKNYFTGWGIIDVTVLTTEWMGRMGLPFEGLNSVRMNRVRMCLRLPRAFRTLKLPEVFRKFQEYFQSNFALIVVDVLKLAVFLSILVHVLACGWFWVGQRSDDGWVSRLEMDGAPLGDKAFVWISSVVWVLAQINGRTDKETTATMIEKGYTSLCAMFAIIFMSFYVSGLTTKMIELQESFASNRKYSVIFQRFHDRQNLSWPLIFAAKEHIKNRQVVQDNYEEEAIVLDVLPPQLKIDIVNELRGPLISAHPLFQRIDNISKIAFSHICYSATNVLHCLSREIVFEKGEASNRMIFVQGGTLRYCRDSVMKNLISELADDASSRLSDKRLYRGFSLGRPGVFGDRFEPKAASVGVEISPGMWLSEVALFAEWNTTGELFCSTNAKVVSVGVEEFIHNVRKFHHVFCWTVHYARNVIRLMTIMEPSDLMDVDMFSEVEDALVDEQNSIGTISRELGAEGVGCGAPGVDAEIGTAEEDGAADGSVFPEPFRDIPAMLPLSNSLHEPSGNSPMRPKTHGEQNAALTL